jgi:hypothetical protein
MNASTRWLAIVAAGIAVAVIAGLAITLIAGEAELFPEGSPERVVQDYVRAVDDRDAMTATSYLSPELAARCTDHARDPMIHRGDGALRATLDRVTVRGDRAEVHVGITETFGSGPFGSSDSRHVVVFVLGRADDRWLITETPWPLYCPSIPAPVR